jgi:hypothetical protein
MSCPFLKREYVGACAAGESPHVPSIAELERYCFRAEFGDCPHFMQSRVQTHKENRYSSTVRMGIWGPPQIPR